MEYTYKLFANGGVLVIFYGGEERACFRQDDEVRAILDALDAADPWGLFPNQSQAVLRDADEIVADLYLRLFA